MLRTFVMALVVTAMVAGTGASASASDLALGGGIHYLRNLGDISDDPNIDLNQNTFSILASAKRDFGLLAFEGQLEYVFDYIGTGEPMWQPSAWLLLGRFIYGGAGIGIGHTDGEWQDNPFYALRAGVDLPIGTMDLDLYASYRFQSSHDLETLTGEDLDSLTFAAVLRFGL